MVVFHTSFTHLLLQVRRGGWHDTPDCLYHFFGAGRLEDIIILVRFVGCSFDQVERTLLQLVRAEREGRVSWRSQVFTAENEKQRFRQTLRKATEMGAPVPWYPDDDAIIYCDSSYMRRFLRNAVLFAN